MRVKIYVTMTPAEQDHTQFFLCLQGMSFLCQSLHGDVTALTTAVSNTFLK